MKISELKFHRSLANALTKHVLFAFKVRIAAIVESDMNRYLAFLWTFNVLTPGWNSEFESHAGLLDLITGRGPSFHYSLVSHHSGIPMDSGIPWRRMGMALALALALALVYR